MLAAFRASAGIVQSVLSGNIRSNAVAKLSAFGLEGFMDFEVGGYGDNEWRRARGAGALAGLRPRGQLDRSGVLGQRPEPIR